MVLLQPLTQLAGHQFDSSPMHFDNVFQMLSTDANKIPNMLAAS